MSLLSQVLGFAFNLIQMPFSLPGKGNTVPGKEEFSMFPFNTLRNMPEPCTPILFKMGENELKFTTLPRGFCSNCCPAKVYRDMRFVLYTRTNPNKGVTIEPLKPGAARRAGVDNRLPTVIFIHGFSEPSPGQSGRAILDAYLSRKENYNLILLDWSELGAFPWYGAAVTNVRYVGLRLKQFIEAFSNSGEIPIENLHLIGFSLGCHIAGIAGKLLGMNYRIPRITGLDPALPEFSLNDTSNRLSLTDAEYVDVIHTDSGIFGFPISVGHADFYPNGGRALQPGCQPSYLVQQRLVNYVVACSHVRAWRLYVESVENEKTFPATKCAIWRGPNKQCNFSTDAYMGYGNTNQTRGSYYLITHQSEPFGLKADQQYKDNTIRNLSSHKGFQKSIQVCILGAHTPLGRATSFLLKQNPLVSVLRVQGEQGVTNLGIDLSFIDTRCKIQSFEGVLNISKAIRSADIVVVLGRDKVKYNASLVDRVMDEGKRIFEIAKECTVYAPRSIILVCAKPISFSTALVEEVFRGTHWYHPSRIVGAPALAQIKANTLLGRYQDLDPKICNVPIIGGPDTDLAVPLFSRASPVELPDGAAKRLLARYRETDVREFPKKSSTNHFERRNLSEAFALNNMISTIGLGICGDEKAYYSAFVRTNLVDACRHLVTTVKFSRGGVVHNCGVPQLTKLELVLLEKAALKIRRREKMAREFLEHVSDGKCVPPPFQVKYLEEKKKLQQKIVR